MEVRMQISVAIQQILNTLHQNGYQAHLVGGCVRDHLLLREQSDFDIATSALPHEIIDLFDKTIPTGIKHGTITVIVDSVPCEVTTYRVDGTYDGRRPHSVSFTRSIEEDLSRRDFTINAIAYDGTYYIDPFEGKADLAKGIIRAVGDPKLRFQEDALRMLRAIRFSAQLGFIIETETKDAIRTQALLIRNISMERIRDELDKILMSEYVQQGILLLKQLGLLSYILPEISDMEEEIFQQTVCLIKHSDKQPILRLVALMYYISSDPQFVLRRLKYDHASVHYVNLLLQYSQSDLHLHTKLEIKKCLSILGKEKMYLLLNMLRALIHCNSIETNSNVSVDKIRKQIDQVIANKEPLKILDLAIDGKDLINMGYQEGKLIGHILQDILQMVLLNPSLNQKEILINEVRTKHPITTLLEDKDG